MPYKEMRNKQNDKRSHRKLKAFPTKPQELCADHKTKAAVYLAQLAAKFPSYVKEQIAFLFCRRLFENIGRVCCFCRSGGRDTKSCSQYGVYCFAHDSASRRIQMGRHYEHFLPSRCSFILPNCFCFKCIQQT